MAKKPDLSGVKTFFLNHGERVGLGVFVALALLLIVWGLKGAMGPGTASGKPWHEDLSSAVKSLRAKIPPAQDFDENEKKKIIAEVKTPPVGWDRLDSHAAPGPYQNINELTHTQRNNPSIFNVLAGNDNFQIDYIWRGWQHYDVRGAQVLAIKEAAPDKKGPLGAPFGGAGGPTGPIGPNIPFGGAAAGGGPSLAHALQPRHMLVVTAIFPMKKQVDEFVKALRLRDASELATSGELPVINGINVFREEFGPDGKRTHTEQALPLIFFNPEKKRLEIQKTLEKELAEAYYDEANPRVMRSVVHEGLVTPLPLLPEGHYPKLRIKGDYWPKEDMVADATETPNNPQQAPIQGPIGPRFGKGFKGSGAGAPPILGPKMGPGPMGEPGGEAEAAPEVPTVMIPLAKLQKTDKELYARLDKHRFNIFHPLGQIIPDEPAAPSAANPATPLPPAAGGQQGMPGPFGPEAGGVERFGFGAAAGGAAGPGPGGYGSAMPGLKPGDKNGVVKPGFPMNPGAPGAPGAPGDLSAIYDAIVRFVDVDVKPNYSYRYYIQVRMKNPNYGKRKEVAQLIFAEIKELRSEGDYVPTPVFTVPGTYNLFAVDQYRVDHLGEKADKDKKDKGKKAAEKHLVPKDQAVVQLHRWFGKTPEGNVIGDWAIAEWLLIRKGEQIGKTDAIVEVPTWNVGRGAFEMQKTLPDARGKKVPKAEKGVKLDFVPKADMPPLLVDFAGGKKTYTPPGPAGTAMAEDAAMDLLILTPDGRLVVRSSRTDIEVGIYDGTPDGTTRQARVEHWRKRNHEAVSGGGAAPEGGGAGAPPILGPR